MMRALVVALILGVSAPLAVAAGPEAIAPGQLISTPLPPVSGYWCRLSDGRWMWIDSRTGVATPPPQQPVLAPGPSAWSNFSGKSRRNVRPDEVHGIKWFLDGRSYFSD
jgi:hypothetical protein